MFETACCICRLVSFCGQQMLHEVMCLPVLLCDSIDKWVVRHGQLLLLVASKRGRSNSKLLLPLLTVISSS